MGIPLLMNFFGTVYNLIDENGNNYENLFFLWAERVGPWGLLKWYNLYSLGGWMEATYFSIYIIVFWWVEPAVILIMLFEGLLVL